MNKHEEQLKIELEIQAEDRREKHKKRKIRAHKNARVELPNTLGIYQPKSVRPAKLTKVKDAKLALVNSMELKSHRQMKSEIAVANKLKHLAIALKSAESPLSKRIQVKALDAVQRSTEHRRRETQCPKKMKRLEQLTR